MFITAIFDTLDGRDVAIVDIPGAFMQVDIDEFIHVKLDDELVDLLVPFRWSMMSVTTSYDFCDSFRLSTCQQIMN